MEPSRWAIPVSYTHLDVYKRQIQEIAHPLRVDYLAGLALVLLVFIKPTAIAKRLPPAALVGIGALLLTLWVTIPIVIYGKWTFSGALPGTSSFVDSYGLVHALR